LILSHPNVREIIKTALIEDSKCFDNFNAVAGVATAGIPHGALLADALHLPFAYVRSKPKSHGRQNLIEGDLAKGSHVLVIEDLISTGGSSIAAVKGLQESGFKVVGVQAIFSYGFKEAETAFREAGCPFKTLTELNTLLDQAKKLRSLSNDHMQEVLRWKEAPKAWYNHYKN
jgi:orotate phosphoribosyltransferase